MELLVKIACGLGLIVLIEMGILVASILFAAIIKMFREEHDERR